MNPKTTPETAGPKVRQIGPYSRLHTLAKLDRRTRQSRLMETTRAELTEHVGGKPSVTQRALIDRAAVLALRLAMMDAQTGPDGAMSEKNAREYLCWHNAYVRTLASLGAQSAAPPVQSLAEYISSRRPAA